MKVKNSIKKAGAVAASGLMVGLSVGGAASLSDFPEPFVEDGDVASQIVVGSTGQVADVVGAVNIAAALGHSAVQTEETEIEGGTTADVDGIEEDTPLRQSWADGDGTATLDNLNYDRLHFGTMETADDEDRLVEESVELTEGDVNVGTNSTEVYTEIDDEAITYTADYETGFAADDELLVLGETYTITEVDESDDEVRLGTREEHRNLAAGDTVEHEMWSFEIIDVDRDANEVRMDVYEDDEFVESATLGDDDDEGDNVEDFGDDDEFRIDVQDVWFGDALDQVHIDTVYTDTIVEDGEPSPFDADWEASLEFDEIGDDDTEVVTELELHNLVELEHDHDDDEDYTGEALQAGDAFAGPGDYFNVYHMGLTDHSTEDIEFDEGTEVTFEDPLTIEHTLALADWYDGENLLDDEDGFVVVDRDDDHVPVTYDADGDGDVTLEYRGTEVEVDLSEDVGDDGEEDFSVGGVTVTIEDTGTGGDDFGFVTDETELHTIYDGEITWDGTDEATLAENTHEDQDTVDDENADQIVVTWDGDGDDDAINTVTYNNDEVGETVENAELSDGDDAEYTAFGSIVEFADDDDVSITHPSDQVQVQHAFGDSETTEVEGETVETVAEQDDLPDMAQLDEDVTESVRDNNHLILVGGPAVNTLTEELHDDGDLDLSEIEDEGSGAVLEVVEDAFADGQHAMVVAGYGAEDTRSASQYIAQHRTNADALADAGDSLVLTEADYPAEQ